MLTKHLNSILRLATFSSFTSLAGLLHSYLQAKDKIHNLSSDSPPSPNRLSMPSEAFREISLILHYRTSFLPWIEAKSWETAMP
ncbi:hypothetical protein IWX91DRAFT_334172 [Phyllosticta citricarpa]